MPWKNNPTPSIFTSGTNSDIFTANTSRMAGGSLRHCFCPSSARPIAVRRNTPVTATDSPVALSATWPCRPSPSWLRGRVAGSRSIKWPFSTNASTPVVSGCRSTNYSVTTPGCASAWPKSAILAIPPAPPPCGLADRPVSATSRSGRRGIATHRCRGHDRPAGRNRLAGLPGLYPASLDQQRISVRRFANPFNRNFL